MYSYNMAFDGVDVSKVILDFKGLLVYFDPMLFDGF
jgi:hypothetical protein